MDKIAVIGLGYVGLPLARLLATKYPVLGYDLSQERVVALKKGHDATLEVSQALLESVLNTKESPKGLTLSHEARSLEGHDVFIITVPTPVDDQKAPDLSALTQASLTVGGYLKKGAVVVYESTVYPGATEEVCLPILEKASGLKYNTDFYLGYSPERINPGDKTRSIEDIMKVTSGSTPEVAQKIDQLYGSVITAGTYMAPSIKVAEAAKVIENAQRDINIAFVNELKQIFDLMQIDTNEVLAAAKTKWNFLDFYPGLVGGHCIGVDPYYLAHKAKQLGHDPQVILSGRRVNDSMAEYHGQKIIEMLKTSALDPSNSRILVLGLSFKANVPDLRNSKVIDLIDYLKCRCMTVEVLDPMVEAHVAQVLCGFDLESMEHCLDTEYDLVVHAVGHDAFKELKFYTKFDYRW